MARTRRPTPSSNASPPPPGFAPWKVRSNPPKVVRIGDMKFHPTGTFEMFWYFVTERHAMFRRRFEGGVSPWTEDEILAKYSFTNVFRVLDRATQYSLLNVIQVGDQSIQEQCFRVLLFRFFSKIETWEFLEERFDLTWRNFDLEAYEKALIEYQDAGNTLYTPAYLNTIPKKLIGGKENFSRHLRILELMMNMDLPGRLKRVEHMQDAHGIISLYPGMGEFMAMQVLLDLNMTTHFNFFEDEWVALGPGSSDCLKRMFGEGVRGHEVEAIRALHDMQADQFIRRHTAPENIPCLFDDRNDRKFKLTMVDIEHALCECGKYSRHARPQPSDKNGGRRYSGRYRQVALTATIPSHWFDPAQVFDYNKPDPLDGRDVYEVSHIVAEKKGQKSRDRLYRIRWVGWGPEADTWERRSALVENAPDVLREWETLSSGIAKLKADYVALGDRYRKSSRKRT
ncbi:uncharacterized protein BXZ73DRAFT_45319 [Epithele typhae]|uniref:uncharacterized protein n=1 Tax=Epithele typhae TaxID=378194 RepID=UPI0020078950|nr:uncharacterized protein BXZ73DRAFT_45319 [Epithele typhae]KAH9935906.1 hypothetical protein BXZ73DRAFT_45319 [Epithele typhae]